MARSVVERGQKHIIEWDDALQRYVGTFTAHDQGYWDGAAWQPVDESLVDDTTGGYNKACTKTRHTLRVGNGGTRRWYPRRNVTGEYVDVTNIQYWRTTGGGSWRNLTLPTPAWTAQTATWDMVNLTATLTNTWRRIKAEFILKDSTAPSRLRFALTLVGLTLGADWNLTSTTDSVVVGRIDPPTATDANAADVPVSATYAGGYVEWSLTPGSAAYPILVDPTFTDGYGGDTTTAKDVRLVGVAGGTPLYVERNYGGGTVVLALSSDAGLLEFNLSNISASATCDTATLSVYQNGSATAQAFILSVYSIASGNDNWTEGTGTGAAVQASAGEPCWEAKAADGSGGVTTAWAGSAGLATSGTDYEASVLDTASGNRSDANGTEYVLHLTTTRVAGWFGATNTNYGLKLVSNANVGGIASSDDLTTGYRPKLVVVYTAAATTHRSRMLMGVGR